MPKKKIMRWCRRCGAEMGNTPYLSCKDCMQQVNVEHGFPPKRQKWNGAIRGAA